MNTLRSIWNQMPTLRLLIPFILGIILCIESPFAVLYPLWIAALLLVLSVSIIVFVNNIKATVLIYQWRYASGVAVFTAILSVGYITTFFRTDITDPHHLVHADTISQQDQITCIGIVSEPPVLRAKTISVLIECEKIVQGDSLVQTEGKVLGSIVRNDSSETIKYGDKLLISGTITAYEYPKNPDQFDYRSYQALHHIYHRVYLREHDWHIIATHQGNPVLAQIYDVRTYFLSLIKKSVPGTNELAVATAIMLGYRDYVTDEVTQAYSGSGVLHVLSVSGLHVAVLYYVLNLLLGWMDRRRRLEILKGVLMILIMLFYAGLTGLSPPVLRSVWMFALMTIAGLLDRRVSMYNILAVSCLVLLIWDPYYIADVGFQLSYIAVVGIIYLYPIIHVWITIPSVILPPSIAFLSRIIHYILDFVWGLISVSIAAQIATLPISLYYFHSFPNLFLLSNLLVIPLSNLVLISGMILFAASWWHWLMIQAGWVFDHLLIGLNHIVFRIDNIPFALSRGMVISLAEMLLCYLILFFICWYREHKSARILMLSLTTTLLLCSAFAIDSIQRSSTQKLIVYDVTGKKAIAFILQRKAYYDFDSALVNSEMLLRYNIKDNWWHNGVEVQIPIDSSDLANPLVYGKLYAVNGKRILLIDKPISSDTIEKQQVDIVILSANINTTIKDLSQSIVFKELVFDSSNRPKRINEWIEECKKAKIKYHNCRDHAFELAL